MTSAGQPELERELALTPRAALRVEVSDLEVSLTGSRIDVVSEISFSLAAGQVMGLVGESGCGKTTVALALLGHARRGLEITRGAVMLDGVDLLRLPAEELRALRGAAISYVAQEPAAALNPVLRVGSQVAEALEAHVAQAAASADTEARVAEVLAEVDLPGSREFLRRYPHQLSGGQQQRIALAMAFVCRPRLIVLDEPTTGLDVTTQRHVLETISHLAEVYGAAAVYVSHDLAVVSQVAQQVAVMYAGRIVEHGSTEAVLATPAHPYTELLLRAVPSLERTEVLEGIAGSPPPPAQRPAGCSFAARCPHKVPECLSTRPALVEVADAHRVRCLRPRGGAGGGRPRRVLAAPRTPREQHAALVIESLSASFGAVEVLHDVSFTVPAEKCVAVVGESGSGKTTLARCIIGLHRNWRGRASYLGEQLPRSARERDRRTLQRIQYVFQDPYTSLNPRKTVGQLVAQPLEAFLGLAGREAEERVLRALEDVSLPSEFITRYPDQLSGGERQRVAIARALIAEPQLFICDEVSSALDVSVQAMIIEMLRRLQEQRHLTMLFITHNLALVREIAESVVVLSQGRVVESGPVARVLEHPQARYTQRLMTDAPKLSTAGQAGS